ncbi:GyrI-like domain-containing protein [Flagellimonas allohymeniacidonis]|uniref:AraC family transcriptional regulator n=1 Tax=Flagellimonas allohymeniacidonis TaxID=2517819 RepID=A0A4V2HSH2_9FLAO|nr:GyrI-like domain-containing protein [Allomuricauda hymeniacidonis]TAI47720.1 AraC family transcriptional regulator [Allomuricauda hymeniacidonis]
MHPEIKRSEEKKLLGINLSMSIVHNRTQELWKTFMPRVSEINTRANNDFISLQEYDPDYFDHFNPETSFVKWAAVEVDDFEQIPKGMETHIVVPGNYAVFHYKGLSSDKSIFQYIYGEWVPKSRYVLDNRPHFEVLGQNYRNNDPTSEEEIWIPIKQKL